MKRALSLLAVGSVAVLVVHSSAFAQLILNKTPTVTYPGPAINSLPANVTLQVQAVTAISQSGSYGTATLTLVGGTSITLRLPAPNSFYALMSPTPLDSVSSDLLFDALTAAKNTPNAFSIRLEKVWRTYNIPAYIVHLDTSLIMTVNYPGISEWSLLSVQIDANPGLDFYGKLVMIDSHGSPRTFQMLRRQMTFQWSDGTSLTLQPLPPGLDSEDGRLQPDLLGLRSPLRPPHLQPRETPGDERQDHPLRFLLVIDGAPRAAAVEEGCEMPRPPPPSRIQPGFFAERRKIQAEAACS